MFVGCGVCVCDIEMCLDECQMAMWLYSGVWVWEVCRDVLVYV